MIWLLNVGLDKSTSRLGTFAERCLIAPYDPGHEKANGFTFLGFWVGIHDFFCSHHVGSGGAQVGVGGSHPSGPFHGTARAPDPKVAYGGIWMWPRAS